MQQEQRAHLRDLRLCCRVICRYLASCSVLSFPTVAVNNRSTSSCTWRQESESVQVPFQKLLTVELVTCSSM